MGQTLRHAWSVAGTLTAAVLATTAMSAPAVGEDRVTSSDSTGRIVGGSPASIQDHPWVVFLSDPHGGQFCGGTIAAPDRVVTAAHCVSGEAPQSFDVVAGRENKDTQDGVVAKVTRVWVHPQYENADSGADIAVLTLDRQLPFAALPLATPDDTELYRAGNQADVLGWGATEEGGQSSSTLLKASPPLVSDSDCATAYPQFSAEAMVCAGRPEGGVDSCQGDSGGPLVAGDRLIGVVSFGNGCARPGTPGVYTRVATYFEDVKDQLEQSSTAAAPVSSGPSNQAADLEES